MAVGAVYDRALVAFKWRKRAVIDRAYSQGIPGKHRQVQKEAAATGRRFF